MAKLQHCYQYNSHGWKDREPAVKVKEGEDLGAKWKEAGYNKWFSYGVLPYDPKGTTVLEVWKLGKDSRDSLPIFLANLHIAEVCIDSIPALVNFCREVKPYVSMLAGEE